MEGGARRRQLGQPALDGGVNVFVRLFEVELAGVQLALDAPETALDRCELRFGKEAGRRQPASVGDAARDVERIKLEIDLQ